MPHHTKESNKESIRKLKICRGFFGACAASRSNSQRKNATRMSQAKPQRQAHQYFAHCLRRLTLSVLEKLIDGCGGRRVALGPMPAVGIPAVLFGLVQGFIRGLI